MLPPPPIDEYDGDDNGATTLITHLICLLHIRRLYLICFVGFFFLFLFFFRVWTLQALFLLPDHEELEAGLMKPLNQESKYPFTAAHLLQGVVCS
jgi:hypothetical protein